jgi:hypothetical protein
MLLADLCLSLSLLAWSQRAGSTMNAEIQLDSFLGPTGQMDPYGWVMGFDPMRFVSMYHCKLRKFFICFVVLCFILQMSVGLEILLVWAGIKLLFTPYMVGIVCPAG